MDETLQQTQQRHRRGAASLLVGPDEHGKAGHCRADRGDKFSKPDRDEC